MSPVAGLPGLSPGGPTARRHECSRARCGAEAEQAIRWRNPRIHGPERRKTWLACAKHLGYLHDFLTTRGFPVEVVDIAELTEAEGRA